MLHTYHDRDFGGDFDTPADYLDPLIRRNLSSDGNRAVYPPNFYVADTLNDFDTVPDPAAPSERHLLGTDDRGRDVLARLVYGFRDSLLFALVLSVPGRPKRWRAAVWGASPSSTWITWPNKQQRF